jgi:hypothetical protein
MVQTMLPQAIDAIVSKLQAAGLTVWDGPIITGNYDDAVYIGYDGEYDGEEKAVSILQAWKGLGANARSEDLDIACAVVTLTGNDDPSWKTSRDTTIAILEKIGQVLRADPSLGLGPPTVSADFVAELWPGELYQENGPSGLQARIVFTIHIKTRV